MVKSICKTNLMILSVVFAASATTGVVVQAAEPPCTLQSTIIECQARIAHDQAILQQLQGDDNNDRINDFNLKVYRFLNGQDYFLTRNLREGINAGFHYEGVAFQTYKNPAQDRVALYRCYSPGTGHFASLQPDCDGRNQEGTLGYLARSKNQEATQAVYRCHNGRGDYLTTVKTSECRTLNYQFISFLGYVQ